MKRADHAAADARQAIALALVSDVIASHSSQSPSRELALVRVVRALARVAIV